MIKPVLDIHYKNSYEEQVEIGTQLYGNKYVADYVIRTDKGDIIVSAKWQQVPGTVEQKIIYEIASLIKIIKSSNNKYKCAYIVIGGSGFSAKAKNYLLEQKHREVLSDGHLVEVLSVEAFLEKANKQGL